MSVKSAVVGVGYLGRFHAQKYAEDSGAELVCVVDNDRVQGQKVADELGVAYEQDFKKLKSLGVQCASIVTPTSTHFDVASQLLDDGIDLLVEKPMTASVEEGKKLIEVAKSNGRLLQVGHLERFNPAFRAIKDSLDKPLFFEVRRISPFSGRGDDVDVVYDLMIHDIDIVAHLAGTPIAHVEAVGVKVLTNSYDIANARITFEGGAVANVTASRASFKSERQLRIFQNDVYVSLDYGQKKLRVVSREQAEEGELPDISVKEHDVEERDALRDEISSFINAVKTQSEPEVTGEDGLRALEYAETIRAAIRNHMDKYSSSELLKAVSF